MAQCTILLKAKLVKIVNWPSHTSIGSTLNFTDLFLICANLVPFQVVYLNMLN